MRKLSLLIIICLAMAIGLSVTPANAFYDNYPTENIQFHPQNKDYYDGNLRLKLKNRADIERASATNVHYSKTDGDYYTCSWKYNTNLGTWVCNKNLTTSPSQSVNICPFGYILNPNKKCSQVFVPANAHLNTRGDGWECDLGFKYVGSGCIGGVVSTSTSTSTTKYVAVTQPQKIQVEKYVYYYDEDSGQNPVQVKTYTYKHLATTGAGVGVTLFSGLIGMLGYIGRKIYKGL